MKFTRALLILSIMLMILSTLGVNAAPPAAHFYFAQITDTHLGDLNNGDLTQKIVNDINTVPIKIEFVVHTGDIFNDTILDPKTVQEEKSIFGHLKFPVHFVSGNHDIQKGNDLEKTAEAYRQLFGPVSTKFECNGVVFIMFYTEPLAGSYQLQGYDPLAWLKSALDETKGKPVVIFTHKPPTLDFYNNSFHDTWPKDSLEQFTKLIKPYNVKAIIAGHFHRAEQEWLANVPIYVESATAGYGGRQSTYRIYEYDDGKIGYRTRYPQ